MPSEKPHISLEYKDARPNFDGAIAELPEKISKVMEFDSISLSGLKTSRKFTLWFRSGAKRIFHIHMIRKSGRCVVEMGGLDPAQMLGGIAVCRDHFDRWFGIQAWEVKAFEKKTQ